MAQNVTTYQSTQLDDHFFIVRRIRLCQSVDIPEKGLMKSDKNKVEVKKYLYYHFFGRGL